MKKPVNRIRELRRARGLTAAQLGEKVGTSGVQISRLETGDRRLTVEWMEAIAGALGCKPSDLMERPDVPDLVSDIGPPSDDLRSVADALAQRDICLQTVATDAVSGAGLSKGSNISIDCSAQAAGLVNDGDVVLVSINGVMLLRHFIAPRILITNNERPPSVLLLDDPALDARIVGLVVR